MLCSLNSETRLSGRELTGLDLTRKTHSKYKDVAIIVMTNRERVIAKAFREGAHEFVSKDGFSGELCRRLEQTVKVVRERAGLLDMVGKKTVDTKRKKPKIVGNEMKAISNRIPKIVNSAINSVLVLGETGTGKEVVADLFEYVVGKPFLRVNCAEISPDIIEAELFGAVKGAYTGAVQDRPGLIESADCGWIFLDEIYTLPLSGQSALLRVIENKELRRVGDNKTWKVGIRVIAASNQDLAARVDEGMFKEDLLYRLKETSIHLS